MSSGVFLDNAQQLVPQPAWSDDQISEFAQITLDDALAHGLTSIHDAAAEPYMIKFWQR
jgi:predicted amidohydrolase YtcJ